MENRQQKDDLPFVFPLCLSAFVAIPEKPAKYPPSWHRQLVVKILLLRRKGTKNSQRNSGTAK
jgi:hypothetical protein